MKILETGREHERNQRIKRQKQKCPECGYEDNCFGTYTVESKGFFKVKSRHINTLRCFKCGCKYEYEDDWE